MRLGLNAKGVTLFSETSQPHTVTSRKWVLFLCHLAASQQLKSPDLTFDHLASQNTFAHGRNGPKSTRTIAVEIDNFRRTMQAKGLSILKQQRGPLTTYALSDCLIDPETPFFARLGRLRGSTDALAFWIKPPLKPHFAWLFAAMRSKVDFARGHIEDALQHQQHGLAATNDPFLNAATYAEIARISYRADRDLALDMRDQAMDFVESGKLTGIMAQIYAPRIRVSYAFQDDLDPDLQCQNLDAIAGDYISRGIDIAGLCRALNTRGNMRRRATNDAAGLPDFQLATALAVTSGDHDLLQASLFNLLASLEFSSEVSPQDKIAGAELNSWFCAFFNIGADSAQSELLLSQFYIEAREFDKARALIKRAAILLGRERNASDVAFFLYAATNLRLKKALHTGAPLDLAPIRAKLARAGRIYARIGNIIGTRKIERLLATLDETR